MGACDITSCVCGDVAPCPLPQREPPPGLVSACAAAAAPPGAHSSGDRCAPAQAQPLASLRLPPPCPALPCPGSRRHIGIPARQWKDGAPEQCALCRLKESGTQKLLSCELVYCSGLFKNARVESLQISPRHKILELPFRSKSCSCPGQGHSGAASPWWGRCCGCYGFDVARWHHCIPENLRRPLF